MGKKSQEFRYLRAETSADYAARIASSHKAPPFVRRDPAACREWARCEPAMRQRGFFDLPAFEAFLRWEALAEYCRAWANLRRVRRRIAYLRRVGCAVPRWQRQKERDALAFTIRQAEDAGLEWNNDGRAVLPSALALVRQ